MRAIILTLVRFATKSGRPNHRRSLRRNKEADSCPEFPLPPSALGGVTDLVLRPGFVASYFKCYVDPNLVLVLAFIL
jgi:hypothetical protein